MLPFFVVTQPVEAEILKLLHDYGVGVRFGLLTYASTSKKFKNLFKGFPVVKIAMEGTHYLRITYPQLFDIYENLGVDYGMASIDYKNPVENAEKALQFYQKGNYSFKLVGIMPERATLAKYLDLYKKFQDIGYRYIAVGEVSVRAYNLHDFFAELIPEIQKHYSPEWLFTFNFQPQLLPLFQSLGLWGSAYRGWYTYDRNYSFVLEYLKEYGKTPYIRGKIEKALQVYAKGRALLKSPISLKEREEIKDRIERIRIIVDKLLGLSGLSLKELRHMHVMDRLIENLAIKEAE